MIKNFILVAGLILTLYVIVPMLATSLTMSAHERCLTYGKCLR